MMTAEFMLSKRPVLRFTAALLFLLELFLFHIYRIPIFFAFNVISLISYHLQNRPVFDALSPFVLRAIVLNAF